MRTFEIKITFKCKPDYVYVIVGRHGRTFELKKYRETAMEIKQWLMREIAVEDMLKREYER